MTLAQPQGSTSGVLSRPLWDKNLVLQPQPEINSMGSPVLATPTARGACSTLGFHWPLGPSLWASQLGALPGKRGAFPCGCWVVNCERLRTSREQVRKSVQELTLQASSKGWPQLLGFYLRLRCHCGLFLCLCNLPRCSPRSTLLSQFCFSTPGSLSSHPQLRHQHRQKLFSAHLKMWEKSRQQPPNLPHPSQTEPRTFLLKKGCCWLPPKPGSCDLRIQNPKLKALREWAAKCKLFL